MVPKTIAIIGGLDADLIMIANRIPDRGESVLANEYLEALGGKGANSAIATHRACHKKPSEDPKTTENREAEESINIGYAASKTAKKPLPVSEQAPLSDGYGDDIQVKMIGAVGDDRYLITI